MRVHVSKASCSPVGLCRGLALVATRKMSVQIQDSRKSGVSESPRGPLISRQIRIISKSVQNLVYASILKPKKSQEHQMVEEGLNLEIGFLIVHFTEEKKLGFRWVCRAMASDSRHFV